MADKVSGNIPPKTEDVKQVEKEDVEEERIADPSEDKKEEVEEVKAEKEDSKMAETTAERDKENQLVDPAKPLFKQDEEETSFRVIYNKNKYDVSVPLNLTVMELKTHLQTIIGVPQAMQKVMIRGLAKDDRTLKELGVTKGAKIMVVGSKLDDVLAMSNPGVLETAAESTSKTTAEPFCKQKMHRKVLDKGLPDDAMPGISNMKETLPHFPLSGMLNKAGGKVRLTFKLELDQLWIGSKERTEKIPMNNIKMVVSEPIENYEQYHIMAFQLGPTEASRYWVYWVPAQYVDAIKSTIMGAWPL